MREGPRSESSHPLPAFLPHEWRRNRVENVLENTVASFNYAAAHVSPRTQPLSLPPDVER